MGKNLTTKPKLLMSLLCNLNLQTNKKWKQNFHAPKDF
jgi:hypothetical protein